MKLKKLIYILLVILLVPARFAVATEEYPYLPTFLKEEVIEFFDINTAGKTMLYERVNIYDDFDAWMIGWFDSECRIVAGITDTEDIIYYSASKFEEKVTDGKMVTPAKGEEIARAFLMRVMPQTAIKLVSSAAYEYTYSQTHNGIRLLGRDATVVVDKLTGEVVYYKGFGADKSNFELMEQLITPEHAFENFYENIGLELVYNTVFDHSVRMKRIRPMYILNRSKLAAIDAQTGQVADIVMRDYNYYYNDSYYDKKYYHDNNIFTQEKLFTEDGTVSASGYDVTGLLGNSRLGLSNDEYSAKITPGRLEFYSDGEGNSNMMAVLRIDIVPMKYAVNVLRFTEMFDSGNTEWLSQAECETPFIFARAYVCAETGRLIDYETVENRKYSSKLKPLFNKRIVDNFVKNMAGELSIKYYGMVQTDEEKHMVTYARYADGIRVIGEGVTVVYDASLRAVTDFSIVFSNRKLFPVSFMKNREQIKETVKQELKLELVYVDKNDETKFVVYDVVDKNIAFDPVTGNRLRPSENSFIGSCTIGSGEYMISGNAVFSMPPIIHLDKLCLPVDIIASALGYDITTAENEIVLSGRRDRIILSEDSTSCYINDEEFTLDIQPVNVSGTTYVSAGSLRTVFGMFVSWDTHTDKIYLVK